MKNLPTIKQAKINELLINNNHKCLYCGIKVERKINIYNIAVSCASYNLRKGTKLMKEFLQILGAKS